MFESTEGSRRSAGWYFVGFFVVVFALLAGPLIRAINHLFGITVTWMAPGLIIGLLYWIAILRAKRARGRMIRVLGIVDDVEVLAPSTNDNGEESALCRVNVRFQVLGGSTTSACWFGAEEDDYAVGDSVPVFYEPGRPEWAEAEPYPYNEAWALGCGGIIVTIVTLLGGWILSRLI